ncbi:MAG: hypothetical protein AB9Q22_12520 [Candidatus Reddybacter sp.]
MMSHVAVITVKNNNAVFKNSSMDHFANGVEISDDGHIAKIWIDDTDADVAVTGASNGGELSIAINTNSEYGAGPYILASGSFFEQTSITNFKGLVAFNIT